MNPTSLSLGEPDWITLTTDADRETAPAGRPFGTAPDARVSLKGESTLTVSLTAGSTPIRSLALRWTRPMPADDLYLGDAWERGYGRMGFQTMRANRFMPWYFLAAGQEQAEGYGVATGANAFCFWQVDTAGITLFLDLRNGGSGLVLDGRQLEAATIICLQYPLQERTGGPVFAVASDFCSRISRKGLMPPEPVYGSNNWYYAYGDSSRSRILADAEYLADLTQGNAHRPTMVVDDGWQDHHRLEDYNGGPWRRGNQKFGDMGALADQIKAMGIKPGIWYRPLLNEDETIADQFRLPHNGCLDPSNPQALDYIRQDIAQLGEWGYQLVKHDFSTFDLLGRWGFQMNPWPSPDGWHFYDRSLTSAQVVKQLYRAIFEQATEAGMLVQGCNVVGHLGVGFMQINRTGDDTSGLQWERTRQIGVNTLAFRLPQHGSFYATDADCVGISDSIDWELNRQWMDLLARTGTPLFFSARPGSLTAGQEDQLRQALALASTGGAHAIPSDWLVNDCPEIWTDDGGTRRYSWYQPAGLEFSDRPERYDGYLSAV